ncbi:GNAT family N-acetyltransferase [Pseudooctadecabacter jejudonensis]|uniref:BioF2-like acetyltransferase domain-containing protein n=1 Tax=Pseudooctadecabacter jejudonensis TaxID=1391910 RepID=A0A1Y5SRD0_9RHOB|nr:GNAT family N-acetyltransferase [Pseudooctadecabacter jejudonensis]SLN46010.1 hypothetical protein PSJ8397_02413 [Pseudooctadecabacter jejudonensis]
MTDVKVLKSLAEINEIATEWTELHTAANGSPFSHVGWQQAWLKVYLEPDVTPVVITVWNAGQLVAVAPFAIRRAPIGKFKRFRPAHLTMLAPDRTGFHDLLARPGFEDAFRAVFKAAANLEGVAYFDLTPMQDNPALGVFCDAARTAGAWVHSRDEITTSIADLSGDWDDYLARRGASMRKGIRRNQKKLAQDAFEFRVVETLDDDGLEDMFSISERSWKAIGGTDIGSDDTHRRFIEELFATFGPSGAMSCLVLYHEGVAVSSCLDLFATGTAYGLISDYDDSYAKMGVGRLVHEEASRLNQQRGITTYDFLRATHFTRSYGDRDTSYQRIRISTRPGLTRMLAQAERRLAALQRAYGLRRKKGTGRRFILGERPKD